MGTYLFSVYTDLHNLTISLVGFSTDTPVVKWSLHMTKRFYTAMHLTQEEVLFKIFNRLVPGCNVLAVMSFRFLPIRCRA